MLKVCAPLYLKIPWSAPAIETVNTSLSSEFRTHCSGIFCCWIYYRKSNKIVTRAHYVLTKVWNVPRTQTAYFLPEIGGSGGGEQAVYGSEFWTMYNWPFSDLEHFYYTWFAPSYSETISFGVVVKSTIRAFRKHYTLYTFTHFCTSHGPPNAKKMTFLHFFIFRNHPVNFQATLLILSNYIVSIWYVLGLYHKKIGGLRANIWSQGTIFNFLPNF